MEAKDDLGVGTSDEADAVVVVEEKMAADRLSATTVRVMRREAAVFIVTPSSCGPWRLG